MAIDCGYFFQLIDFGFVGMGEALWLPYIEGIWWVMRILGTEKQQILI